MGHLKPDAIETGRLESFRENRANGAELVAIFEGLRGMANGHMIGDELTAASGTLQEREHLFDFAITQLLKADKDGSASERENQSHSGGVMQKGKADETEARSDGVEKQDRFALRQSALE